MRAYVAIVIAAAISLVFAPRAHAQGEPCTITLTMRDDLQVDAVYAGACSPESRPERLNPFEPYGAWFLDGVMTLPPSETGLVLAPLKKPAAGAALRAASAVAAPGYAWSGLDNPETARVLERFLDSGVTGCAPSCSLERGSSGDQRFAIAGAPPAAIRVEYGKDRIVELPVVHCRYAFRSPLGDGLSRDATRQVFVIDSSDGDVGCRETARYIDGVRLGGTTMRVRPIRQDDGPHSGSSWEQHVGERGLDSAPTYQLDASIAAAVKPGEITEMAMLRGETTIGVVSVLILSDLIPRSVTVTYLTTPSTRYANLLDAATGAAQKSSDRFVGAVTVGSVVPIVNDIDFDGGLPLAGCAKTTCVVSERGGTCGPISRSGIVRVSLAKPSGEVWISLTCVDANDKVAAEVSVLALGAARIYSVPLPVRDVVTLQCDDEPAIETSGGAGAIVNEAVRREQCRFTPKSLAVAGALDAFGPQVLKIDVKRESGASIALEATVSDLRSFSLTVPVPDKDDSASGTYDIAIHPTAPHQNPQVLYRAFNGSGGEFVPEAADPQFVFRATLRPRGLLWRGGQRLSVRTYLTASIAFTGLRFPAAVTDLRTSDDEPNFQLLAPRVGVLAVLEPWNYIDGENAWPLNPALQAGMNFLQVDDQPVAFSTLLGAALTLPVSSDSTGQFGTKATLGFFWEEDLRDFSAHFVATFGVNLGSLLSGSQKQ